MISEFGFLQKIHFVGIGGIGMSGIAEVLHNLNFIITGSDVSEGSNVSRLKQLGIEVFIGHNAKNVKNIDVLVYSSAISLDNPEIIAAKERYIPVIPRAEMLAELMRMRYAIAVAGSHGKTTVTSMISEIFTYSGADPTTIIGGKLNSTDNNAKLGKDKLMVVEADESDRSFLMLYPTIAIITNIDIEHMDTYLDIQDMKNSFIEFTNRVPFFGFNVICLDDKNAVDIIPYVKKRFITYGLSPQADVRALNIKHEGFSVSFDLEYFGKNLGRILINLPGIHTILNSLAAITVALEMRIEFPIVRDALISFKGVQRRMTIRYKDENIVVIDDYGHHPTEIRSTLKAIKEAFPDYKICAIFQPHRYTRTMYLLDDFSTCFFDAHNLLIMDIYPASEKPIEGVDSYKLLAEVKRRGFKNAEYVDDKSLYSKIESIVDNKTVFVTLGAGSITRISHEIADYFRGLVDER